MNRRKTQFYCYGLAVMLTTVVVAWNIGEYFNTGLSNKQTVSLTQTHQELTDLPKNVKQPDAAFEYDVENFWKSFEKVQIEWEGNAIKTVSIPDYLKKLDGQIITVQAISFLIQDGVTFTNEGCDIHRSLIVPPFGVIFCCSVAPILRYEWTIIVNSEKPWHLVGEIPNEITTIVTGRFRIATDNYENGIFFVEQANVRPCSKDEIDDYENICL